MIPATKIEYIRSKIPDACAYLYFICSLFLFAILPMAFHGVIYRPALIFFFISFILDYTTNKRWQKFRFTIPCIVYLCLIAYYLLLFVFWPVETNDCYLKFIAEDSLALVGFSLAGIAGGFNEKFKIKYFAISGAIAPIAYSAYIISKYIGWGYFFEQDFGLFREYNHLMNIHINAHMGFNFFCNVEILLTYYLFKNRKTMMTGRFDKAILYGCVLCSIIILLLVLISGGRAGIMCTVIVLFYIILDLLDKNKKILTATSILLAICCIFFITKHPRFQRNNLTTNEPRSIVWDVAFENIMESPLIGYGGSTTYAIMQEDLLKAEWPAGINTFLTDQISNGVWWGGHPHNQLMQSWLFYGITGLLLMLAIFILPFFSLKRDSNYLLFCCLWLCLLFQLQTEVIATSISYIGFGFWLLFMFSFQGNNKPMKIINSKK